MTKITNQNYPNGLNPLGYMGVNAPTPGQQVVQLNRAPTVNDAQNFTIGTQWLADVSGVQQIWELVSLAGGVATWVQLYPAGGGGGGASEFPTDSGTANEIGGVLQIKGDGENISTEGSSNLVNVVLNDHITVQNVTVESMNDGVVISDNSGNLTSINGTDGQVLIAATGAAPVWALPLAGANIAITGGAHTLTIGTTTNINIPGTLTLSGYGQGVLQTQLGGLVASSIGSDGQVLIGQTAGAPDWRNLTAGANITITNAPNSITISASGGGGGGITTLTANTGTPATAASIKLQGNNVITTNGVVGGAEIDFSLVNGADGQVLIGGGGAPLWRSITAGTNITLTPGANSLTIAASGSAPAAGCAFLYYQPSIATGVTAANVIYYLGQKVIMTRQYDAGGFVTPGDGAGTAAKFTAPATGLYYLQFQATLGEVGSTAFFPVATITITGNPTTQNSYVNYNTGSIGASNVRVNIQMSGMFPMTIGDVAIFGVSRIPGGATGSSSDVYGSVPLGPTYPFLVSPSQVTYFSGFRVA